MDILTKSENIEAFRHGLFGNTLEVWDTVGEFLNSNEPTATIRCKDNRGGGGFCLYCIPKNIIMEEISKLLIYGAKESDMWFHANPSPTGQTLQFEYQHRDESGWINEPVMTYTMVNAPMRNAMAQSCAHAKGHIYCHSIIKQWMSDASYSAFCDCLDRFPCHVLEVSCFSENVGVCRGHNALIWEVRKY